MLYSVVLQVFYFSLSLSLSLTHSLNLPHSLLFTKDFYAATLPASRSYLLEGVGRCWWRLRYILSTNSISANYSLGSKPSSSIEDGVCIIISPIFRVPIPVRSSFLSKDNSYYETFVFPYVRPSVTTVGSLIAYHSSKRLFLLIFWAILTICDYQQRKKVERRPKQH